MPSSQIWEVENYWLNDNDAHAQTKPKSSRWEEIIKSRDEIKELEIEAKTIQRIYKRKGWSLRT